VSFEAEPLAVSALAELSACVRASLARVPGGTGPSLVGCSGGADSTALALAAAGCGPLVLAHVDHGIHQDHARAAAFVRDLAARLGAGFALVELALGPRERSEAAMRERRYEALAQLARLRGAAAVLTAHHADDELETLLMRLSRGTGLRGLCGIRASRPLAPGITLLRPLLEVRKSTLERVVADAGLVPVADPTNADVGKTRNHVRHELLPALREHHGAGLDAYLFALLEGARATVASVSQRTAAILADSLRLVTPWRAELALAGPRLARPFALDLLSEAHKVVAHEHATTAWSERALALCDAAVGARVDGGSPLLAERTRVGLLLADKRRCGEPPATPQELALDAPPVRFGTTEHVVRLDADPRRAREPMLLDRAAGGWPWRLRARRAGERFWPLGREGPVELAGFLQRRHVPRFDRDRLPILVAADDRPLAIAGLEVAHEARVTATTTERVALACEVLDRMPARGADQAPDGGG
jgi:tRNA(Ile)-lysidine synthase